MRVKRRYLLLYCNAKDPISRIKDKFLERFNYEDFTKASLKLISEHDSFVIVRCNLSSYGQLIQALRNSDEELISLNTSGTLKALRSRIDQIKRQFRQQNRY